MPENDEGMTKLSVVTKMPSPEELEKLSSSQKRRLRSQMNVPWDEESGTKPFEEKSPPKP